ncbi:MAG: hypothetical protein HQL75_00565 [Magnetococcales bacterium]|nr:hypothetical protein [Magnetococcales bacterium]
MNKGETMNSDLKERIISVLEAYATVHRENIVLCHGFPESVKEWEESYLTIETLISEVEALQTSIESARATCLTAGVDVQKDGILIGIPHGEPSLQPDDITWFDDKTWSEFLATLSEAEAEKLF